MPKIVQTAGRTKLSAFAPDFAAINDDILFGKIWSDDTLDLKTKNTIVEVPEGEKHWHGAAPNSWFSHLAFMIPGENPSNEWLEPVDAKEYAKLK